MLSVVVPLASQRVVGDWAATTSRLNGCVGSILGQVDGEGIRAVVVGHEEPPLVDDPRVEFISVDFDPPSRASEPTGIRDKFRKLSIGFQRVGELGTTFAMRLDADDHISSRLAGFVNARPETDAWNLVRAYHHTAGRPYVQLFDDWVEHAILNRSVLDFPQRGHIPPDPGCLFTRWGHQQMSSALACREIRSEQLPFPAACYVRHAGSLSSAGLRNRGRRRTPDPRLVLGRTLRARPFTRQLRQEFALRA